uniref:Uncharacterized protein n=1 Tax=Arundo donax TaxID=35708 RepID=A0A0A9B5F3_ARUDO
MQVAWWSYSRIEHDFLIPSQFASRAKTG